MRFKIGSSVEVFTKKKAPSGAWRCAEIVADNRDSYTVRYYRCPGIAKEEVLAELLRPCPPPSKTSISWAVGDVVEVLDGGFWRVSTIEEILGGGYYQIRVIGSIDEFRVEKSSIRLRQEWKDTKWVQIGKVYGFREDLGSKIHKRPRTLDEAYSKVVKRQRVGPKEDLIDAINGDTYSFVGNADAHATPRKSTGKSNQRCFIKLTKGRVDSRNHDDCVSSMSSVGSCSVGDAVSDRMRSLSSTYCSEDSDSICSDADSYNPSGDVERVPYDPIAQASKARESDLYGYRYLLEQLYASGPLSWKQELALTNIRKRLCVSNDEHLMELRRLRCTGGVGLTCH